MNKYIVFYGQQVYGEYEKPAIWDQIHDFPDGCYLLNSSLKSWYIRLDGGFTRINLWDIPPEVRVNCLLLGIQI